MVHGQEERKINKGHYNKDKGKQYNNYYYKFFFYNYLSINSSNEVP